MDYPTAIIVVGAMITTGEVVVRIKNGKNNNPFCSIHEYMEQSIEEIKASIVDIRDKLWDEKR